MCGNGFVDVLDSGRDPCARTRVVEAHTPVYRADGNTVLANELPRQVSVVTSACVAARFHLR